MLNIACISELESQIGQRGKLFRVVEDMQQNDILELVDKAREWELMANQVVAIENFLRLNWEASSANVEGNLGDTIKDLRAKLVDVKA